MAKTKYNPELVQTILSAIAQAGTDRAGWEAGGISKETFYQWINKYPDFSDGTKQAKAEFRETCPEVLIQQARKAFADHLFGRVVITQTSFERGATEKLGSYSKEITKRIKLSPPRWAIERVLGKPLDVMEALKILAEAGFIPYWVSELAADEMGNARKTIYEAFSGLLPERDRQPGKPGLSPEAAGRIRAEILGIDAADPATLSSSLGSGSEPSKDSREVATHRN